MTKADALSIARRTKPAWPCIHELSLWLETQLGDAGVEIIGMNKGGTVESRGLKVIMVHADHSAGDWLPPGEPMTGWRRESAGPMYLGEPVGFVVELEDGRRVYFAGDTALFRDMEFIGQLHTPDVAFLPIGGHFTMDPEAAARRHAAAGRRGGDPHPLWHLPHPCRHARAVAPRPGRAPAWARSR